MSIQKVHNIHHHHKLRRSSVLTSESIQQLTAHPSSPLAVEGSSISGGVRRQSMAGRRQSVTATRRFSVQQLLVQPESLSALTSSTKGARRLSLQPLASSPDLKLLNTKVAESSYKKDRRASLQPTPTFQPPPSSADVSAHHATMQSSSGLLRSLGFRAMSSSGSSFALGGSGSFKQEDELELASPTSSELSVGGGGGGGSGDTSIKMRKRSSVWGSLWGKPAV
jgi:hypothetical protein